MLRSDRTGDDQMNRDQVSEMVYGMHASQVYLELERERLSEKDLLVGHLLMKAFDTYEQTSSIYGEAHTVSGFTIRKTRNDHMSQLFAHPFALRPEGLIEQSIRDAFPEHHHLFTNASVDGGGYVTVRGIHANDLFDHPHVCACFGLVEDRVDLLLSARLSGLRILDIPTPSDDTLAFMRITLTHNRPEIQRQLAEHRGWLNSMMKIRGLEPINDLRQLARGTFYSWEDHLSDGDALIISQQRFGFMSRHPGSEHIFGPFPEPDRTLRLIRETVQSETNPKLVDGLIERRIGSRLWAEFRADPERFCSARIEKRVRDEPDQGDDPCPTA